ncbi:hypothetical protein KEM56_003582 [Ascosphaera pollenicola]|nr:hypothetical protein KEM56_003582 [Ascosphaera pollenicola]
MVVFVDLDLDGWSESPLGRVPAMKDTLPVYRLGPCVDDSSPELPSSRPGSSSSCNFPEHGMSTELPENSEPEVRDLNVEHRLAVILNCYPAIVEIAKGVDFNTLHALSGTCRQFHAALYPNRSLLAKETLRCENELLAADALEKDADPETIRLSRRLSRDNTSRGRCVRDLVKECTKCHAQVCRNCIGKPFTSAKPRSRRLCSKCLSVPITAHTTSTVNPYQNFVPLNSYQKSLVYDWAFCRCEEETWLCIPCTRAQHNEDTMYRGGWTWRSKYSSLFAPGTWAGIGEGCEGVKCGRGAECFAAQEAEVEIEGSHSDSQSEDGTTSPHDPESIHHQFHGSPGYFRQEIVGIGGRVRHKIKKRIAVGACVEEYPEERDTGTYLVRETTGSIRSWCGWCSRVIPSKAEKMALGNDESMKPQ